MHVSNALGHGIAPPETGIAAINYGFSALAVVAAVLLARGDFGRRLAGMRTLAAMALFLLAASFVHFGRVHRPDAWLHELVFHHAGIPLSLFVLLLDYRFLLLDVFVRLAGAGLLAAAFAAALLGLMDTLGLLQPVGGDLSRPGGLSGRCQRGDPSLPSDPRLAGLPRAGRRLPQAGRAGCRPPPPKAGRRRRAGVPGAGFRTDRRVCGCEALGAASTGFGAGHRKG